jgi:lipopolysaccharide/colanic/teichoic acid biosynthesis glycosyltransferase
LYYVDNQSFFFDIKILLLTVLSRKAYQNAY